MSQIIYHLVGHEIMNKTVYIYSKYISCVNGKNFCKIAKNGNFKVQIYEVNDISSCKAENSEQNAAFF